MIIPIFITKLHIAIVAGDQLNVTFNGDYEITCQDSYPNQSEVDGRIKDFAFKKLKYIASILITAPLGAILMDSLYKKLLNRNTQDSKGKTPIIAFNPILSGYNLLKENE